MSFKKNGDTRYIQVSASPIRNRNEEIIAAASIISDITDQKKIELRKDDFVNMASHELKTPLTSIKLYTDIIERKMKHYHDREIQKIIDKNQEQIRRLQILVDDLLDVSRIQTGKLTFQKEIFDIHSVIQDTIELTKEAAAHHPIVYNRGKPVLVYADKFRIYQVLTNLITNAVKYSPKNSEIIIVTEVADKQVIVSVQDSGIGIPESEHEKIFERLYQVFESADQKSPGFGMGLFISKEIIRKHKGKIWVESEPGKGSTFYISLPLAKKPS
ncbi:PAS domain S-box protein [Candidatus Roizmanbacteria bacterium]|nr:MAG: PAS domain S-box protein [Candidatus Roizmanbacteria bacterium]